MKALPILLLCATASAQPITSRHLHKLDQIPQSRVEACKAGCYVLTHAELIAGLQAAHNAGARQQARLLAAPATGGRP